MKICFSYDCEGHWGFVNWPNSPLARLQAEDLTEAYDHLCRLHMKHDIPATFAFVALYGMEASGRKNFVDTHMPELVEHYPNLHQSGGLWDGAANLSSVLRHKNGADAFEIASHSLTHIPAPFLSDAQLIREFRLSQSTLYDMTCERVQSYIYPQNAIRLERQCLSHFKSFRQTSAGTIADRLRNLGRLAVGYEDRNQTTTSDFIHWHGGARKPISDRGWKAIWWRRVQDARAGRSAERLIHVWSHPHNLLTDPRVPERLSWLLRLLSENRRHFQFFALSSVSPNLRTGLE